MLKNLLRLTKCRVAIQPATGYMKSKRRLERNYLKETLGNPVNVLLSSAAMNPVELIK
jgi:hypothetical protein